MRIMHRKTAIIILLLLAAIAAAAAATSYEIPIWTGRSYSWFRPGPGLTLKDGVIDVLPAQRLERVYNAVLTADDSGSYPLPANAQNVVAHRNGLRLTPGVDYTIEGSVLKSLEPWPGSVITVDFDR